MTFYAQLEGQEQKFFCNWIGEIQAHFLLQEAMLKSISRAVIVEANCVMLQTFWTTLILLWFQFRSMKLMRGNIHCYVIIELSVELYNFCSLTYQISVYWVYILVIE